MVQASVVPLIGPLSYDHCAEAGITAKAKHRMVSETIRIFKARTLLLGSIRKNVRQQVRRHCDLYPCRLFQLTGSPSLGCKESSIQHPSPKPNRKPKVLATSA